MSATSIRAACSCRSATCRNGLPQYGGDHVKLRRIALTRTRQSGLPSFPASDKRKDPRYTWFIQRSRQSLLGDRRDGPDDLRECVEQAIKELIEPTAWARCETVNAAELESLQTILSNWKGRP